MNSSRTWVDHVIALFVAYGFQAAGAVGVLLAGALIARWGGNLAFRKMESMGLEPPIRTLIARILRLILFAFAVVIALGNFGVNIAPLVAGIGVAGVGLGRALQGILGNLMAGLTIIFTKPFRVGEYIELLGVQGEVVSIELFSTTLLHADRSRVVVPNRKIVGEILHNYGQLRQLPLRIGVAFGTDLSAALATARDVLGRNPRVVRDPPPVVGIVSLDSYTVTLALGPWVPVPDYVDAQAEIYRDLIEEFGRHGIVIPLPQRVVRVLPATGAT